MSTQAEIRAVAERRFAEHRDREGLFAARRNDAGFHRRRLSGDGKTG